MEEKGLIQEDGGHRPQSSLSLAPTIDDFEILKPISRGAFGKVFLCHRKNHPERKLAVKVMNKAVMNQKNMKDQVIAERNAAAIAKSDFCVGLLYSLQTTNNVFLVMEYMIGGDLKSLLGNYGFFPEHQAVFYLAECVLALQDLHRRGIVHRDIKPDNMLLSAQGHLKLTDFGLSTTGLKDRELQVTDLVGRTPWLKGHSSRLVRTPGQILSLTSHISFSHTPEDSSIGGSNSIRCSSVTGGFTTPLTTSHIPAMSPSTAPALSPSNRRILRKISLTETLSRHTKEQEVLTEKQGLTFMDQDPPSSPLGDNSSFKLQELPNSSLDISHNNTMEDFNTYCAVSIPIQSRNDLEDVSEVKENIIPEHENSTFLKNRVGTPPRHGIEDEDSRGSLSSSPKTSAKLLHQSFLEENINISPVSVGSTPQFRPDQFSVPVCSPSVTNTDRQTTPTLSLPFTSKSQANSNIRSLRKHSEDSTPEKPGAEMSESFGSDINLEDSSTCSSDRIELCEYEDSPISRNVKSHLITHTSSSDSGEVLFKAPVSFQCKRKVSCAIASPSSSFTSGLTDDLTDLVMTKRRKSEVEMKDEILMDEDEVTNTSSSVSVKSSFTLSEEAHGSRQGFSTPVPLSAVPLHVRGSKAVKFISPAEVTPVQLHLSQPLPLSLAHVDRLDESSHSLQSSHSFSQNSTPLRTPKSVGRRGCVKKQSDSRLLGTPDYLAPELLLSKGHSMAVDWWALGVCLYEFLVGIPPFTDSTPEAVFNNILGRNMEWPEGEEALSNEAVTAILALLEVEPTARADGKAVRAMELTKDVNWDNILSMQAPFIPNPDDATDTTYFDARNSMQGLMVSAVDL